MDISSNTALIEALLLEEHPACNDNSDAGVSDEETEEDVRPLSPIGFDEVFEEALDRVLTDIRPSSPANEDVPSDYLIDQVPTSPIPSSSVEIDIPTEGIRPSRQRVVEPNRKWKKRQLETTLPEYSADTGVIEDLFAQCTKPTDMTQYLPMKPIKRGYKLWCLADQRGYIKKF